MPVFPPNLESEDEVELLKAEVPAQIIDEGSIN